MKFLRYRLILLEMSNAFPMNIYFGGNLRLVFEPNKRRVLKDKLRNILLSNEYLVFQLTEQMEYDINKARWYYSQ